jgi:hypothetical protein
MKSRKCFSFSVILCVTLILSTLTPISAKAYSANNQNCAYYDEVSSIATAFYANEPDEFTKTIGYDTIMAGVLGENYKSREKGGRDLIGVYPENKVDETFSGIFTLFAPVKEIIYSSNAANGTVLCCFENNISLNSDGINEENYNYLKLLYNTAELLKGQTENMDDVAKARVIHDYIVNAIEYNHTNEGNRYCAAVGLSTGIGSCQTYTTLMYLFGRYCGLDVENINYRCSVTQSYHSLNTIVVNGELRYIDATWDDDGNTSSYFMQTQSEYLSTHPGA